MVFIQFFNERVKRFTIYDIKLVQGAAIFTALVLVKLVPQIMNVSIWWFVLLAVLCALRPLYVMFLKK